MATIRLTLTRTVEFELNAENYPPTRPTDQDKLDYEIETATEEPNSIFFEMGLPVVEEKVTGKIV